MQILLGQEGFIKKLKDTGEGWGKETTSYFTTSLLLAYLEPCAPGWIAVTAVSFECLLCILHGLPCTLFH